MAPFRWLSLCVLLLAAGCQAPWGGNAAGGLNITLRLTQPSLRSGTQRLLLPNATTVDLRLVRDGKTEVAQTLPITAGSVTFSADVEARVPYEVQADARDAAGTLVFSGAATVTLFENRAFNLYLLPVLADGSTLWPALRAADQKTTPFADLTVPAAGTSQSVLVDFGTTGTSFTFQPLADGLALYAQNLDGSPLLVPTDTRMVTKASLSSGSSFWATYYQTGTGAPGAVGSFTIPVQALTLPKTLEIGPGGKMDLGAKLVRTPANTTETAFDWSVADTSAATVDAQGSLVGGTPSTVPAATVLTVKSQADPTITSTSNLTVYGPEFSHLASLAVSIDTVDQGLPFVQGTTDYALATASSTATQTLTLTATAGSAGQTLGWSTDGKTWTALTTAVATDISVPQGTTVVDVRVIAANGSDTTTYALKVTKTIVPDSLVLTPDSLTLATNKTGKFAVTVSPDKVDDPSVTWTIDDATLATIDATTGLITPLLPGQVVVTATSNSNPLVSVSGTVDLTPSSFTLKASQGAFWTDLLGSPTSAPAGSVAIAGNETALVSLDDKGVLKVFQGGLWESLGRTAPTGSRWLVVDSQGLIVVATPTRVYYDSQGIWSSSLALPPVAIQGLAATESGVRIWGTDGNLWDLDRGIWTRVSLTLPVGTDSLVGNAGTPMVTAGGLFYEWTDGAWRAARVPVLPHTVSSTFAFRQLVSLIVQ